MQLTWPGNWGITNPLPTYQIASSYNDADQATTTTTSTNPAGQGYTTTNVYDSTTGALVGLGNTGNANANVASLTFTPHGLINTITLQTTTGSGLASEQFSYDANLRPRATTATWQSGSGTSGTILTQSRSYDAASNVTSLSTVLSGVPGVSNSGGSEVQNFCYNEQNQLSWAGNSGSQPGAGSGTCGSGTLFNSLNGAGYGTSFVYTHLGQLWQGPLNGTGTAQQYLYCDSTHPHQLTGLYQAGSTCSNKLGQGYASSYDAWGNVTSRSYNGTTATLSYDGLDQLVKWDAGSNSQEQYVYDAAGQRVLRRSTVAGSTTMTVYAFGTEEHLYSGAGVNQSNTYYYSLAGHLVGESTGSSTNLFLTDALGSVITTISATAGSAAVQGDQAYGPYGNTRYQAGTMGTAKGFTGQYQDATGLDYYGARYYDPVVGRFVSADTVQGNQQGMDPYAYVGGNPETNNDPTGQKVVSCAQASHSRCEGPEGNWGGVGGGGGGWDGDSSSGAPSGSPGSDQLTPEEQLLEQETAKLDQELHLDPNAEPDLQAMELRGEELLAAERAQEEKLLAEERAQEAAADQQAASPPAPTDQGESTPPPAPPPTGTEETTPAAPERTAPPPEQPPTPPNNTRPSGFPGENSDDLGTPRGFADDTRLNDHFNRHSSDFGASTPREYQQQAADFLSGTPDANELQLQRPGGDYVRYDPTTGEFGIVTPDGTIRTYYDISGRADPLAYFLRQFR